MGFSRLERRLRRISGRLVDGVEEIVSSVASEIGAEVVPATPVDTGFARGNWRPSLNVPSPVPVTILDPTGAATVSRIRAVAQSYRVGDTIFIRNNADYIDLLNRGSSPQAPPGFVQVAVRVGTSRGIRRATFNLRIR